MNRQIIPSMILSVLIVCFFSIVLYERDKPAAAARPKAGEPASAAKPVPTTSQGVDKPAATSAAAASKGPDSSQVVDEGPARATQGPSQPETPPAGAGDQSAPSSPVPGPEQAKPAHVAEAPAVPTAPAPVSPGSAPGQVATSPADPVSRPEAKPASHAAGSAPGAGHRSAFTTVRDGETLEDVTLRVYGSSDQLDVLWRANRDLLPHRNSPLCAGAVLRTPEE